jgi:FlaA1/EpsC-like NDP-sugar epimerase
MRDELSTNRSLEIKEIGAKPGEKMYEELMNDEEVRRTRELDDFFVVLPPFIAEENLAIYSYVDGCPQPDHPYNSAHVDAMSLEELRGFVLSRGLLD